MSVIVVYGALAALVVMFWRRMWGLTLQQMLERPEHEHHVVQCVLCEHPRGGAWPLFKRWAAVCEQHESSGGWA